jgi:hypothetical protein
VEIAFRSRPQAKSLKRILSWHHAVDEERSIVSLNYIGLFTYDRWQVARDGLEQVGLSHDSLQHSIFI